MSNEAKLTKSTMLAMHMASLALKKMLGDNPIWSDMLIKYDRFNESEVTVHMFGNRIHVPGTKHLYKVLVSVKLIRGDHDEPWCFRDATIHLHHPRTGDYDGTEGKTFVGDLEPGLDNVTLFTSLQEEVDNPRLAYDYTLPALSSHFVIPE